MQKGFGLSGFRSFDGEAQFLEPLKQVNILAGQNNAGKSNIIRAVQRIQGYIRGDATSLTFEPRLDYHQGMATTTPRWHFPLEVSEATSRSIAQRFMGGALAPSAKVVNQVLQVLRSLADVDTERIWWCYDATSKQTLLLPAARQVLPKLVKNAELQQAWYAIWSMALSRQNGTPEQHHVPELLARLAVLVLPEGREVHQVGPHRRIGAPDSDYQGLDGSGLIGHLLRLQSPEFKERANLERFDRINQFVQSVVGSSDARLEIPHSGRELLVDLNGRLLPIESLGTGIQQVIVLAAAATTVEKSIVCIEEPEVHLHPRLQRKLIAYLKQNTSNQYFITTHSAALLDAPDVALFHVRLDEHGATRVDHLDVPGSRSTLVTDLGYKASDLVQANCIIWVEGPSDRVYVNLWLRLVAPELIEGLHYSVMFYGGRLLAHLSADDSSVSDFIQLQRLNRHVAILIDSDRKKSGDKLGSTKRRVIDEVTKSGGFSWVTKGREVENYLPSARLLQWLAELHPRLKFKAVASEYEKCYQTVAGDSDSIDKVALAVRACTAPDLSVLDLKYRVETLAEFIRKANA